MKKSNCLLRRFCIQKNIHLTSTGNSVDNNVRSHSLGRHSAGLVRVAICPLVLKGDIGVAQTSERWGIVIAWRMSPRKITVLKKCVWTYIVHWEHKSYLRPACIFLQIIRLGPLNWPLKSTIFDILKKKRTNISWVDKCNSEKLTNNRHLNLSLTLLKVARITLIVSNNYFGRIQSPEENFGSYIDILLYMY